MEDDRKVKRDVADVERRKRSFKEIQSGVSDDLEEYRRKKLNVADLMAKHFGKDELCTIAFTSISSESTSPRLWG